MRFKNRERIDWAVEMMAIQAGDEVLELGCGPGVATQLICEKLQTGKMLAMDRSAIMTAMAASLNGNALKRHVLKLYTGLLSDEGFPAGTFDKVFAINVSLFWTDTNAELKRIQAKLKQGGTFYLFHQPPLTTDRQAAQAFAEKMLPQIKGAGFENVSVIYKALKPVPVVCLVCKTA